jgi:hypothetical protein
MKVRGIRTLWTVVLSMVITCAYLGVGNVGASPGLPELVVEPHFVSADVGSIFTVDIIIENLEPIGAPAVGCYGYQVHLEWDPAVLNFSSHYYDYYGKTVTVAHLTFGDFYADAPSGSNDFKFVDYVVGWTEFGESMMGDTPEDRAGMSGNGWLATCEFEVIGTGETVIDIKSGYLAEPYALTFMLTYYDDELELDPVNAYFLNVPSPWATDLNEDGRIDIRDVARVARKWGWEGTPGSIPEDVNDDGYVDIVDLTAVAGDYGTQYYP